MKLRAEGFVTNGTGDLRGTLIAVGDDGRPLGFEHQGNFSKIAERERVIAGLVDELGESNEVAKALMIQTLMAIRDGADSAPTAEEHRGVEIISALLPGLVDVVAADDGHPTYLFITESGLVTADHHDADGVRYVPPELAHFPYLLPNESDVRRAYIEDTDEALFYSLVEWHQRASKLQNIGHYQLIALFDIHTWIADLADYSPYLTFQSRDSERGKTRAGQAIAWVSYRGIHTETLQEANLFRWSDSLQATMFFDVRDLWRKAEKRGSDDLLLSRFQRNGPKVSRVLDPQAGPFKGVVYFNCYGPTVLAINEPLREPLTSRTIEIVPPEASGRYPTLKETDALLLKARGAAFRARHLLEELPAIEKPADGRLGDIMQPLAQVAAIIGGDLPSFFPSIVDSFRRDRQEARSQSPEASLLTALQKTMEKGHLVGNVIPTSKVMEAYNEGLSEKAQLTDRQVGVRLKNLGFLSAERARDVDGVQFRGRVINDEQLAALQRKFGLVDEEEGPGMSHSSHTSQPDTAQACDNLETTGPSENENLRLVSQHVTPHDSSYSTPRKPGEASVTSNVHDSPDNICNCPAPEHYAEGEAHPSRCPDCKSNIWCKACLGCVGCRLL